LGTLIGADLTNLDKVRGLGAPVPRSAAPAPLTVFFSPAFSPWCCELYSRRGGCRPSTDEKNGDRRISDYHATSITIRRKVAAGPTLARRIAAEFPQASSAAGMTNWSAASGSRCIRSRFRPACSRLRALADAQPRTLTVLLHPKPATSDDHTRTRPGSRRAAVAAERLKNSGSAMSQARARV